MLASLPKPNFLSVFIPNPSLSLDERPHGPTSSTSEPKNPKPPVARRHPPFVCPRFGNFSRTHLRFGWLPTMQAQQHGALAKSTLQLVDGEAAGEPIFFRGPSERPNFVRLSRRCSARCLPCRRCASVGLVTWRR